MLKGAKEDTMKVIFDFIHINWIWIMFITIAIATPSIFISLFSPKLKQNANDEDAREILVKNLLKNIILFWNYDLFFISICFDWKYGKYIFGIIAIIVILFDLTQAILGGFGSLKYILAIRFIFVVGISIYLIYIIDDIQLRNIILAISSAIYGGLLTLLGVAWTIKSGEESRICEIKRIHSERTEEDRVKNIPYIKTCISNSFDCSISANIYKGIDLENDADVAKLNKNVFYSVRILDFKVKNVSNNNIIIKGIKIDERTYEFKHCEIIEKGTICEIHTTDNWEIPLANSINEICLIVEDMLGNEYEIKCLFSINYKSGFERVETETTDGKKYVGFCQEYNIISTKLPQFSSKLW